MQNKNRVRVCLCKISETWPTIELSHELLRRKKKTRHLYQLTWQIFLGRLLLVFFFCQDNPHINTEGGKHILGTPRSMPNPPTNLLSAHINIQILL